MRGRPRQKTDRYPIHQCALYKLRGMRQLAELLFSSESALLDFASRHDRLYREWDTEIHPGKSRRIECPIDPLKQIQARIELLLMRIAPPDFLFCPVKMRDFLQNALQHHNARAVWRVDIKNYFQSVQSANVEAFFRDTLGCANDIAVTLTKLTTYQGHLPTGSPSSPILSYFANKPMWDEICAYLVERKLSPSLYMDDLAVSGNTVPWAVRNQVLSMLNACGFKGHKEKYAVNRPALVTGLVIGPSKPTLPHSHFRKLRTAYAEFEMASNDDEAQRLSKRIAGLVRLRRLARNRAARSTRQRP